MKSCFILRRDHGPSIYLTPFQAINTSSTWNEEEEITWFSSSALSTHEKDDALFSLYMQIDRGVDRWIQDARYIPRLLMSAAVFLVTYFFFSLAVRDPLPMVDELLISSGVSVAFAMYLTKRDKKSEMAMKRRMELKQNASRSDFELLDTLTLYEDYLTKCTYLDSIELADRLSLTGNADLPLLEIPEANKGPWQTELADLLLEHLRIKRALEYKKYHEILEIRKNKKGDEAFSARLLKLAMAKSIDLPLLAFVTAITKQ
ncbi:MAG: hypothetical protein CVV52_10085 [Spirochaetae bacterium HGW-Spirochaetae-8]|jgi:hypothetical protein|nr:MAG: hypothetical protein CVV52_10085 [Spirochaetae bacterium HGW-Spirochaetae-8]